MASDPTVQEKPSMISLQLGIIFWLAQALVIFSFWRYLPPQLPLFYSRPWGEEQLASRLGILILPGLSLGIILGNLTVSTIIPKEGVLIKQILLAASAVFNLLCLITLIQIINLIV